MNIPGSSKLTAGKTVSNAVPVKTPFFYGWMVVAIGALGIFFSGPGQTYSVSVYIESYIHKFGWDRTLVSEIYSVATLFAGLLLFFVGRFIDKYGQRAVTVAIGFLFALACFWNSWITGPIMLFIGFFFIRLLGQGSMTLIPNTLVPQWFVRYRGRAMSFLSLGGLLGAAVFPPLNNWLIETWGWQMAWRISGGLLMLVFVPLAYLFIMNKPEDVDLLPDNEQVMETSSSEEDASIQSTTREESSKEKVVQSSSSFEDSWTLSEAMRTRAFWFILFCVMIPSMVITGITFHLFSILGQDGISRTSISFVLSFVPFIGFLFTLASGFIVERMKVHYLISFSFLLMIISMLVLLEANSKSMLILFVFLWGVFSGFITVSLSIVWPNYFGRTHLGSIKSIAMTSTVIGSAFGPIPFGWAYDHFGGYHQIILAMTIFPLLAMIAAFISPKPLRKNA